MLIKENKEEVKALILEASEYIDDYIETETRTKSFKEIFDKYIISKEYSIARWILISSFLTALTLINATTMENLLMIPIYWILLGVIELPFRK